MKYIIVVDKQPRTNSSSEKREYEINIDELRKKGDVHDDFKIEEGVARVYRRIGLTKTHMTYILDEEIIEELGELKIKLFEGDNYIYIKDEYNNQMCAEYIVKSDFTDMYVTRLEMSSAIEQTAQSIDLSVNRKLEGYSTTQEMQSAINMKADSIELKVNNTLKDYSTTEEMNSAIQLKADSITSSVNSSITNKLKDYSTTTQMNSTIVQKANEITSTVSSTYETKTNVDTKINTAKSQIKQTTDSITTEVNKKVNNSEFGTKVEQNAESIQIAWNKITEFIQFINAQLQIKDNNKKLLMALDKEGQKFYHNGLFTGKIGSTQYKGDNAQKGLAFNLDENGKFMCWGVISPDKTTYYAKLWYNLANSFGNSKEELHIGANLDLNGFSILGENLELCEVDDIQGNGHYYGLSISDDVLDIALFTRNESWFNSDLYVKGYKVLTNTSDGRLKKEIYNSTINALDIIEQIQHRQFTWKKDDVHENIGYIAQELEEIDSNYVHKNAQYDEAGNVIDYTYQVNLLPILSTTTKAIQELNIKVKKQQQTIENQQHFIEVLAEKLNMQEKYNTIVSSETMRKTRTQKEQEKIYEGEIQFTRKKQQNKKHKVIKQYENGEVEIAKEEENNV